LILTPAAEKKAIIWSWCNQSPSGKCN